MKKMDFPFNWNNKLDCHVFTSLHVSNEYDFNDIIEIKLSNMHYCRAKVIGKKYFNIDQVNAFVAGVDTGYSVEDCKKLLLKMFPDKNINWKTQPIYLYLLRREL